MGRTPCCSKEQGLNRGAWTAMEDQILTDYIKTHGQGKWRNIPKKAGLNRCGKSCRLRWLNYLRPDIKRGNITDDEEELIIRLHKLLGNRWSLIAGRLPGRTDNEIKNYWNTIIGKKINNHSSPAPAPVRRSSSFCAPHDRPMENIPTIKRCYSFTVQPQRPADQPPPSPLEYNINYQNATVPTGHGPSTSFSPDPCSDDTRINIPAPASFTADLEIDKDFISDILDGAEFSQLNLEQREQAITPLLFDQQFDFQTMGSFGGADQLDWLINL